MKWVSVYIHLAFLLMLVACTGQSPAPIKNPTSFRSPIKASCSDLKFEGQVLSKKNILNIFDCSGWAKTYPALVQKLKNSDEAKINHAFEVFNKNLFLTLDQRSRLYKLTAINQDQGKLDSLSSLAERSLKDNSLISQLNLVLNSKEVSQERRTSFMKFLSEDNNKNLKYLKAFSKVAAAFEQNKENLMKVLEIEDEVAFRKRIVTLLNDLATLKSKDWGHVADMISLNEKSVIQEWVSEGKDEDLSNLLGVIKSKTFASDLRFLNEKLENNLVCENAANKNDFIVNVKQELKHKIDSLKNDNKERFEETLLHGFTKLVAFKEFCQEEKYQHGLDAFSRILEYCFKIIPVSHDYHFLRDLHKLFGEDRFELVSFLTSKTFLELRDLFIRLDGQDQELIRVLFEIVSEVPKEDLVTLSEWAKSVALNEGQSADWYQSWSSIWNDLSDSEKIDFVNLMSSLSKPDVNAGYVVEIFFDLFKEFPALSSDLSKELGTIKYQNSIQYLVSELSDENIQKDLSQFLSDKGLFEFISLMTYSPSVKPSVSPITKSVSVNKLYMISSDEVNKTSTKQCYEELKNQYEKNPSYYSLVTGLPEVCLRPMGRIGFVGQIYLWMNSSNKFFVEKFGVTDFHTKDGIWTPEMLQFIFSAAIEADASIIGGNNSRGIKNNLNSIYKSLTEPEFLEAFHLFSGIYAKSAQVVPFESKFAHFLKQSDEENLSLWINNGLDLAKKHKDLYKLNSKPSHCSDLSQNQGVETCLSDKELSENILDILRIAKRRFGNSPTLAEELIRLLHPNGGIPLPFNKKTIKTHSVSFEELVRFLYDLSSDQTVKEFTYYYPNRSVIEKGTSIDRLEVLIRDISFNNNFYGAYFKNEVAGYESYRKEMMASETLMKWMKRLGGVLRGIGMDSDSKWRLKNVKGTYSSLVEVSDQFPQFDGGSRSYDPFIQGLLAAIATSSRQETQSFSAYRAPKNAMAEGHNGIFLTKIVETSGLRHLARFARSRFKNLEVLNSKEFKQVNEKLIARHDLKVVQTGLQNLLDNYLDADRNQMNLMIEDSVGFISSLSKDEQDILESISLKLLLLLSDEKVSTDKIQKVGTLIEVMVKKWPELRLVLKKVDNKKVVLQNINKMMDSLVAEPASVDKLIEMFINGEFISFSDLEKLLDDEELRDLIVQFLNHTSSMNSPDSDINWVEVVRAMVGNPKVRFAPLLSWFETSLDQKPKDKLSVSLLLQVLGEKTGKDYRLKLILDEFFINHATDLDQFLNETFPALQIKAD